MAVARNSRVELQPEGVVSDLHSLDVIIPALNELTSKRIQVSDLLEFDYSNEPNEATFTVSLHHKVYRFRLEPNKAQEEALCRVVC